MATKSQRHKARQCGASQGRGRYCVVETNASVMFCPRRKCFTTKQAAQAFQRRVRKNGVRTKLVVKK